jgi:hypothetical protein
VTIDINLPRVHVIGMGEVGRRLAGALRRAGVEVLPVTRTQGWEEARDDNDGLCLVCVREETLAEVLDTLHNVPAERLVLIQNGWIRPLLHDLAPATRGLIWFTAKDQFFQILRPNFWCGPRAADLALALAAGGLPSEAVDSDAFAALEADKIGFNCIVGLPLVVHGSSLGDYLESSPAEARAVYEEAVSACSSALGVDVGSDGWEGGRESARHLAWVRVARAKALDFRNGAVVALASEQGTGAPVNAELLLKHARMCATNADQDEVS